MKYLPFSDTHAVTGLREGDAHQIRNAGGRAADALRSLVISQELLGTREIIVIHHTYSLLPFGPPIAFTELIRATPSLFPRSSDCGMLTFSSEKLRGLVKKRVGVEHHAAIESIPFLEFSDLDASIKEDVAFLQKHPLILPETVITGFKYHVS